MSASASDHALDFQTVTSSPSPKIPSLPSTINDTAAHTLNSLRFLSGSGCNPMGNMQESEPDNTEISVGYPRLRSILNEDTTAIRRFSQIEPQYHPVPNQFQPIQHPPRNLFGQNQAAEVHMDTSAPSTMQIPYIPDSQSESNTITFDSLTSASSSIPLPPIHLSPIMRTKGGPSEAASVKKDALGSRSLTPDSSDQGASKKSLMLLELDPFGFFHPKKRKLMEMNHAKMDGKFEQEIESLANRDGSIHQSERFKSRTIDLPPFQRSASQAHYNYYNYYSHQNQLSRSSQSTFDPPMLLPASQSMSYLPNISREMNDVPSGRYLPFQLQKLHQPIGMTMSAGSSFSNDDHKSSF